MIWYIKGRTRIINKRWLVILYSFVMYVLRKKNHFILLSYSIVYSSIFLDSISLVRKKILTKQGNLISRRKNKQANNSLTKKLTEQTHFLNKANNSLAKRANFHQRKIPHIYPTWMLSAIRSIPMGSVSCLKRLCVRADTRWASAGCALAEARPSSNAEGLVWNWNRGLGLKKFPTSGMEVPAPRSTSSTSVWPNLAGNERGRKWKLLQKKIWNATTISCFCKWEGNATLIKLLFQMRGECNTMLVFDMNEECGTNKLFHSINKDNTYKLLLQEKKK